MSAYSGFFLSSRTFLEDMEAREGSYDGVPFLSLVPFFSKTSAFPSIFPSVHGLVGGFQDEGIGFDGDCFSR